MSQLPFRQQLEAHNQPEEVRQRLAAGNYNQTHARIAQEYLDSLDRESAANAAARAEAREEINLSISRKALRNSHVANVLAAIATLIALIAIFK